MDSTAANDPALDPSRIDGFYTELSAMHLELDADPLELGPKRLNGKIAECRSLLTKCERIFLALSQDLHRYNKALRVAKADLHLAKVGLFTNDPEVRMGRNVADREAIASNRLRPQIEEIDRLTGCVEDLNAILVVVKAKRADLKDTQGRLKDQLKVCQEEISLGGRWGRPLPSLRHLQDSAAQREVNDLMASALQQKRNRALSEPHDPPEPEELPPVEEDLPIPADPTSPTPEVLRGDGSLSVEDVLSHIPETPTPGTARDTVFEDGGIDELLSSLG